MRPPAFAVRLLMIVLFLAGWAGAIFYAWKDGVDRAASASMLPTLDRGSPAVATAVHSSLENLFREFAAQPELKGSLIGFCLLDEKGQPVYVSPLGETALCPASSLKTLTTGAAFSELGPQFRFHTSLASAGTIGKDGTLSGDLVLIGGGDPTLATEDLQAMVDTLVQERGLKRIDGGIRVQAAVFPENPVNDHWNWGDIGNAYGAGAYGLNLDHNRLVLTFAPAAKAGESARFVKSVPEMKNFQWENRMLTGEPNSGDQTVIYAEPYGNRITMRGTVPAGVPYYATGAANPNPAAAALDVLKGRLSERGVAFKPKAGEAEPGGTEELAGHDSDALPEIIDHLHRVSDNLEAQCLFLTLGRKMGKEPAAAVREHWQRAGVSFTALRLVDGSGLARANMIRPVDLAAVNYAARHSSQGDRYLRSLSLYSNGVISSKLGAMSGVKTEAGFLRCEDGRELTFALMANGLDLDLNFWALKAPFLEQVRKAMSR